MANNARAVVDDVLGRKMTREIWSGNYDKVLPVSVQDFELSAILPRSSTCFALVNAEVAGIF